MLPLWYHPIYTDGLDPEARFPRDRYRLVRKGLAGSGAAEIDWRQPAPIRAELLEAVHDSTYINDFLRGTLDERAVRRIGLKPWTPEIVERTLILTNGTVEATRWVLANRGFAGNTGGGTHHAYADFGSGYCIFNDLAVAVAVARSEFGLRRVLILDLDVHQGDGTAAIFENDPDTKTISLHCGANFPFRKMQSDVDVELEKGTEDGEYLSVLEQVWAGEVDSFEPELILFQAGVDTLQTDRLGHLSLTCEGLRQRNEAVFSRANARDIPLVVTMGGGYGEPIETSVAAHVDLFSQAAELNRTETRNSLSI
ncbi:MAG: histone deacetylase [Verrucomicrobiota bacterium]